VRVQDQRKYYPGNYRAAAAGNLRGSAPTAASAPVSDAGPLRKCFPPLTQNLTHSLPSGGDFFYAKLKIFCTVTSINSDACKSCMVLHANNACEKHEQGQYWRGLSLCMQLHEKRRTKRAGVAGIALRAEGKKKGRGKIYALDVSSFAKIIYIRYCNYAMR